MQTWFDNQLDQKIMDGIYYIHTSWNNSHQISILYLRCHGLACRDLIWTNALWSRSKREIHRPIANWSLGIFSASKGPFMFLPNNLNYQIYKYWAHNGKEDIFQSNIPLHLTMKHLNIFFTHFYSSFTIKKIGARPWVAETQYRNSWFWCLFLPFLSFSYVYRLSKKP